MRRLALALAVLGFPGTATAAWIPAAMPGNPTVLTVAPAGGALYAGSVNGLSRSDNGGATWRSDIAGLAAGSVRSLSGGGPCTPCLGTDLGVWTRPGATWQRSGPGAPEQGVPAIVTSGATILAAASSGGIRRSDDGGATWSPPAPGHGMPTNEYVSGFASGPTGELYAVSPSGVFRSTDAGATWQIGNLGLPDFTQDVVADPHAVGTVYAGSAYSGVYRSTDDGDHWAPIGSDEVQYVTDLAEAGGRIVTAIGDGDVLALAGDDWVRVTDAGREPHYARTLAGIGDRLFAAGTGGISFLDMTGPQATTPPSASGVPQDQQELEAEPGGWDGTPDFETHHQWQRRWGDAWSDVPGETATGYVLSADDVGAQVRVVDTVVNAVGRAVSASEPVGPIGHADEGAQRPPPPALSFETPLRVGAEVVATSGTDRPQPAFAWYRCSGSTYTASDCTRLASVSGDIYLLRDADVGSTIFVRAITGVPGLIEETAATGTNTAVLPPVPAPFGFMPAVSGPGVVGESLVGVPGQWTTGTRFARRWLRCNSAGEACAALEGHDDQGSIVVGAADLGKSYRFEVTGLPGGPTLRSSAVPVAARPAPTPAPGRPDLVIPRVTAAVRPQRVRRRAALR